MNQLLDSLPLLAAPFIACLMITVLHGYVGLHVIKRGVIFVDLALAQAAALGAAVALFISPYVGVEGHHQHAAAAPAVITEAQLADQLAAGDAPLTAEHAGRKAVPEHEHPELREEQLEHATLAYGMSLAFALLAAVLLAFSRFSDERIPHEAIIGIIFVVCAALSVLILSKAPHGHEKMAAMLVGSILFVRWSDVLVMAPLYLALGVFHIALRCSLEARRRFLW